MPVAVSGPNADLSAVFFRVVLAGQSAEYVVQFLRDQPRRILLGRQQLQNVVDHLTHAAAYLQASGADPARLAYIQQLVLFYRGLLGQLGVLSAPANAGRVADSVYNAQGSLLAAAPFLPVPASGVPGG